MVDVVLFSDVNPMPSPFLSISDGQWIPYAKSCAPYRLATELRARGFSCQVIDTTCSFPLDQLKQACKNFIGPETLMVGFCTTFMVQRSNDGQRRALSLSVFGRPEEDILELITSIKDINSKVKVVVGGSPVAGREPKIRLDDLERNIDYWASGQGESTIVEITKALKRNAEPAFDDMYLLTGHIRKMLTAKRYPYNDFYNSITAYTHNDLLSPSDFLTFEVARGCVFNCKFCDFDLIGKKWGDWTRTEDMMYTELERNYRLFNVRDYWFCDDTINDSVDKSNYILKLAKQLPFDLSWKAFARLDLNWKYPDMAKMMLDSGCHQALFGIETFNQKAGAMVGKGLGEKRAKDALEQVAKVWGKRASIFGLFIIGLWGDTRKDIEKTVEYACASDSPIDQARFAPLTIITKTRDDWIKMGYSLYPDSRWTKDDGSGIHSYEEATELCVWANAKLAAKHREHWFDSSLSWPPRRAPASTPITEKDYLLLKAKNDPVFFSKFMIEKCKQRDELYRQRVLNHKYDHSLDDEIRKICVLPKTIISISK